MSRSSKHLSRTGQSVRGKATTPEAKKAQRLARAKRKRRQERNIMLVKAQELGRERALWRLTHG